MRRERNVKMLLVLPLLVVPFIAMIFWALGGGADGNKTRERAGKAKLGIKIEIPDASISNLPKDKLSYYSEADADSARRAEEMRNDPYLSPASGDEGFTTMATDHRGSYVSGNQPGGGERQVYDQLNTLNSLLDQSPKQELATVPKAQKKKQEPALDDQEVTRLEQMMNMMKPGDQEDPELQQLSGMLENILDIQHPARVEDRLKKASQAKRGKAFVATLSKSTSATSILSKTALDAPGGFFNGVQPSEEGQQDISVPAAVHGTQVLTDGSIVKLRLLSDIYLNGEQIPKGSFVYGLAKMDGERLHISIDNIRNGNAIYPVKLQTFGLDGIDGIYVPGAIGRDAAKQSGSNALQGISMSTMDPSLGAQAASAGIELSKNFFGRKVKLIKVTVKGGYQVLLRNENNL